MELERISKTLAEDVARWKKDKDYLPSEKILRRVPEGIRDIDDYLKHLVKIRSAAKETQQTSGKPAEKEGKGKFYYTHSKAPA